MVDRKKLRFSIEATAMDEIWVTPVIVKKEEAFDWMAMPSK
jgi:hypothetical protein